MFRDSKHPPFLIAGTSNKESNGSTGKLFHQIFSYGNIRFVYIYSVLMINNFNYCCLLCL